MTQQLKARKDVVAREKVKYMLDNLLRKVLKWHNDAGRPRLMQVLGLCTLKITIAGSLKLKHGTSHSGKMQC